MTLLKTKEAAMQLAVSETTVRRWISQFPSFFPKDSSGRLVFDASTLGMLRIIKQGLEEGVSLQDINLSPPLTQDPPSSPVNEDHEQLLSRLNRIETSLSQKADEVVSFQLLSHRQELDELRLILTKLTVSMDALQLPQQQVAAAAMPAGERTKRRKLLRTLFPFL